MSTAVRSIVVGIYESPDSDAAVRWAVTEARARDLPIDFVHAYGWPPTFSVWSGYLSDPRVASERVRQEAENVLSAALERARSITEDVDFSVSAVDEFAVTALVERSEFAELVVLGSRQLGNLRSFLAGSVGTAVAARARCPVVVTRGAPSRGGFVLVGIDGSPVDEHAIRFAVDEARAHSLPLHVVLCWHQRYGSADWILEGQLHYGRQRADAHLSDALVGWREKYPEVEIIARAVEDRAVPGLLAQSSHADLVVVGRHGRKTVPESLLGSVSQSVLHHAQVPVAIVPGPAAEA